jgi:hypothetical protein
VTRWSDPGEARVARALRADSYAPLGALCSDSCQVTLPFYAWDARVGSAVEELLRHVERAISQGMNSQLTIRFERADWWQSSRIRLHPHAYAELAKTRSRLERIGASATSEAITARVSFGFWTSLLGRGIDYETKLWRPALHRAFPRYRGERIPLYQQVDHLRELRNYLAHPGGNPVSARDVVSDHAAIHTVMDWICRDTAAWLRTVDRVPAQLAARPGDCAKLCIPRQRGGR